jgi:hypothetical protein
MRWHRSQSIKRGTIVGCPRQGLDHVVAERLNAGRMWTTHCHVSARPAAPPFAALCGSVARRIIDRLYNDQPIVIDGQPVTKPAIPSMAWHFEDLKFGILDKRTMVFFCLLPFCAR